MGEGDGAILLLYGIPASGKTTLGTSLCEESIKDDYGTFIRIHFDDFYPVDRRVGQSNNCISYFNLKSLRQSVNKCFQLLMTRNGLGTMVPEEINFGSELIWMDFLDKVSSTNSHAKLDDYGRIKGKRPFVFLLDDNMLYHSIRYEYYQIARKNCLGFAEVLVSCTPQLAASRNLKRRHPLPLLTMDKSVQDLEPAQPEKFHWERNSIAITQSTKNLWSSVLTLVQSAILCPVVQTEAENNEQKAADRQQTVSSSIHQTDQVLRKCVAKRISSAKGIHQQRVIGYANATRKLLLEEARMSSLSCSVEDAEFVAIIESKFSLKFQTLWTS